MKKIFSFDAETDGLWGQPFSIGAIVYDESGEEQARFFARMPDSVVTNEWVRDNVLPALADEPVTHERYGEMLSDFAAFYMSHKADADVICHMGYIVEAHLLREIHRLRCIGDWDAPYPLIDISAALALKGEPSDSVDKYASKYELPVTYVKSTHNPLHDSAVAAAVWMHLQK